MEQLRRTPRYSDFRYLEPILERSRTRHGASRHGSGRQLLSTADGGLAMTTIHTRRLSLSAAILAACAAGGALADDPNGLTQCSSITNTAERLACYDKLAGRASASKTQPSSPTAAAPAAAPVSAAP